MKRSMTAVAIVLAAVATACGGSSSKTASPTTAAVATTAQTAATPAPQATGKPATAAPAADLCSRVSAADIEALGGAGAKALSADSATAVAARLRSETLESCRYRSDVALLSVATNTLERYAAVLALDLANVASVPEAAHPVTGVGTEAMLFVLKAPQPYDIDGRTYNGEVLLLAKNATTSIAIAVETTGDPAAIDAERIKALGRTLLQ